ncbi:helicase associated domain-containing protein [Streptomyces sp. NPDC048253]|uniref:helicase associated domain-containing protein n=1 Tax=Streptomyces sp. NPDC048253 TaxID=3365524 RepID=UPI00371C6ED3
MVRTAPLGAEMTLSFLGRIAARFHLEVGDVLAAVVQVGMARNLRGVLRPDGEVYLNAAARARVSALCRIPQEDLYRALPAWTQQEPAGRFQGPAAQLQVGGGTVADWGPACSRCTAARTGRSVAARLYLGPHQRVCVRHRSWLMAVPGTGGRSVDLACCPEVVQAQARHRRLLRRSPAAAEAFVVARAVTASWWAQRWPEEEVWPVRLDAAMPVGEDPHRWRILARDLVTYPETVTLAALLSSRAWRRRITADAGGHLPYRLADVSCLPGELARRLRRPWLAGHLAACTRGPLFAWTYQCVRTGGSNDDQQQLWQVPLVHRPRPLDDELTDCLRQVAGAERLPAPKRLRGHSAHADRAFATGLAHARVYAAGHGHLATPREAQVGSYPLGKWVHNQQTHALALPADKAAALDAVDPWWNIPWSAKWQRSYYRARDHVRDHGCLGAAGGFPDTHMLTGEWLYLQCTGYRALHPEQRRLLADIGLTAEAARSARPRRTRRTASIDAAVDCARAFAAEHGCLALATKDVSYQGIALGKWLNGQRFLTRRQDGPGAHLEVLDAIDPWWNPPWPLAWQRTWHRIRAHAQARHQETAEERWPKGSDGWATWLSLQCTGYEQLHPQQQHLLTQIGITAETAATRPHDIINQLCGSGPGLAQARAYATRHGHLLMSRTACHQEFPVGQWLSEQRHRAREHHRATGGAWPVGTLLTALDPWWNPPWSVQWQRYWNRARERSQSASATGGSGNMPGLGKELDGWLRRQCTDYPSLHPEQHRLLAGIGLTAEAACTAQPPVPLAEPALVETALAQARAYAAGYGHIAAPTSTVLNGFPLGRWLAWQRQRARHNRLSPTRLQALTAIDPYWNPPWPLPWQQAYHRLRAAAANAGGAAAADLPRLLGRWTRVQQESWEHLHPGQQDLLTALGITPHADLGKRPAPATRSYATGPGLDHARAYAAHHGHLTPDKHTHHNGFPLGQWLCQQRRSARAGVLAATTATALTSLDPWWNPPWPYTWHRTWCQYRTAISSTEPLPATLQRWAVLQRTHCNRLHPHQQQLLTTTGVTGRAVIDGPLLAGAPSPDPQPDLPRHVTPPCTSSTTPPSTSTQRN